VFPATAATSVAGSSNNEQTRHTSHAQGSSGLAAPTSRCIVLGTCGARRLRNLAQLSLYSASCERVFSLLKNLFGEEQMSALADYIQAALMLNYNGRQVG